MPIRRPTPGSQYGPTDPPWEDNEFSTNYPTIFEYLTLNSWGPGQPRSTSTIMLFVDNGVLKLCINDRDNQRSAFFTGTTLSAALVACENALSGETADWRSKSSRNGSNGYTPF